MTPEQVRRMLSIAKALERQANRADEMNLELSDGGNIGALLSSMAGLIQETVRISLAKAENSSC